MPEYLSPGVYVEEIELGSKPIEGVSTSTAGFLGETERGPTTPRLITSWLSYQRIYGGLMADNQYLPFAVQGFFDNGGKRCYIGRIVKAGADPAELGLKTNGSNALTVKAIGEGVWGNRIAVLLEPASIKGFKISVFYWRNELPKELFNPVKDTKTTPRPSITEVFDNVKVDITSPDYYETKVNGISNLIVLSKMGSDSGSEPDPFFDDKVNEGTAAGIVKNKIILDAAASTEKDAYIDMFIEIIDGTGKGQRKIITAYDGTNKSLTVDTDWATLPANDSQYMIEKTITIGQADSGAADTIKLAPADTSPKNDAYKDMTITITAGTGVGERKTIISYEETNNTATVDSNWATPPDHTSNYQIVTKEIEGLAAGAPSNTILLDAAASPDNDAYKNMSIEIIDGTGKGQKKKITAYDGTKRAASVDSDWATSPKADSQYQIINRSLIAYLHDGTDTFTLEGKADSGTATTIKLDTNASTTNDFYNGMSIKIIDGTGKDQVRKMKAYDGTNTTATIEPNWSTPPSADSKYRIVNGTPLFLADFTREDSSKPNRKGLAGFTEIDEISIVYSPNSQDVDGLTYKLIEHCEAKRRFAIIDSKIGMSNIDDIKPRDDYDKPYAAFYYPWIKIVHPTGGTRITIPPGGHIAGIFARSDTERGVHKAPANEIVNGAVELEFQTTQQEQDILNPRGVNVIRAFPGRGIRVWGARTLSSDSSWKYINVRRLFNFLEQSIDQSTQWVVFEPNDEKLWARVRRSVNEFLTRVWRDGALMGTKQEQAFFVRVDDSTMTKDDINNGRLIVLIGVAPVKPAEFVIFRIAQVSSGLEINEA